MQDKQRTISPMVEGRHYVVDHRKDLPLESIDFLGHGGTASVDKVQDRSNGRMYARKIYTFGGSRVERQRAFENEIQVIKRLAPHHHVIRVIATYMAKREVGVILSPVANRGSLNDILQEAHDSPLSLDDQALLWRSFACLSSGLYFMHTQSVRHKDIKPHNILIHDNSIIYTDIGGSLDHSSSTRSTTTGAPASITQRYAAPEVAALLPRSSKTDIFSLGCVFFEILEALGAMKCPENLTPYRNHSRDMSRLLQIAQTFSEWGTSLVNLTQRMLNLDRESRPSAWDLTTHLWNASRESFCGKCQSSLMRIDRILPTPSEPTYPFRIKRADPVTLQEWSPAPNSTQDMVSGPKDLFNLFDWEWLSRDNGEIITPGIQESLPMVPEPHAASKIGIEEHQQSFTPTPAHINAYEDTVAERLQSGYEFSSTSSSEIIQPWEPNERKLNPRKPSFDATMEGHRHSTISENTTPENVLGYRDFQHPETSSMTYNRSANSRNPYNLRGSVRRSENSEHKIKPRLYHCDVVGCRRWGGFTTSNDLERHKKAVHRIGVNRSSFQCVVDTCRNRQKIWQRLDMFKQHIERMHPNEDANSLIERSVFKSKTQEPLAEPPIQALLVGTGERFSE